MMKNTELKTNILYSRVSSSGQSTNTSLTYQSDRLVDYCNKNNISNLTHIQDVDSGGHSNRNGVKQMTHLIGSGIVNTIYITKLDRLYRSVLEGAKFIQLCLDNDVDIQATDEPISTKSPVEMLQINILLSIADFERSNIAIRTSQGKKSTFDSGNRPHGNVPIGYKLSSNGMVIDEEHAPLVDKIFRRYNKHKSLGKVKSYLNNIGATTNRNKPFRRKSIYNILKNPTYAGLISYMGETNKGNHTPIISKRLFTSVNNTLCR
jgi:DNA invertase Pin-like site-specific DNA recombinase